MWFKIKDAEKEFMNECVCVRKRGTLVNQTIEINKRIAPSLTSIY